MLWIFHGFSFFIVRSKLTHGFLRGPHEGTKRMFLPRGRLGKDKARAGARAMVESRL